MCNHWCLGPFVTKSTLSSSAGRMCHTNVEQHPSEFVCETGGCWTLNGQKGKEGRRSKEATVRKESERAAVRRESGWSVKGGVHKLSWWGSDGHTISKTVSTNSPAHVWAAAPAYRTPGESHARALSIIDVAFGAWAVEFGQRRARRQRPHCLSSYNHICHCCVWKAAALSSWDFCRSQTGWEEGCAPLRQSNSALYYYCCTLTLI